MIDVGGRRAARPIFDPLPSAIHPLPQQSLFDAEPPEWELDAGATVLAATVVLPSGPPGEFDYAVPDALADERKPEVLCEPGRRIRAPLGRGNRPVTGYCVALENKPANPTRPLKEVRAVIDPVSLVSPAMLRLTRWMADHYLTPWGQVLEGVVPAGVRGKAGTRDVTLLSVPTAVAARLTSLELPPKQAEVLKTLAASTKPLAIKQLAIRADCTTAPINALRKRGLIESRVERLATDALSAEDQAVERQPPKKLNADQLETLAAITDAIDSGEHETVLVHGVTGSGKTEVYLQAIQRVVEYGRQAIVLVPEISLTPQTVRAVSLSGSTASPCCTATSRKSNGTDHWRRIAPRRGAGGGRRPQRGVCPGTPHLGLIVIDEEHEATFKQDTVPSLPRPRRRSGNATARRGRPPGVGRAPPRRWNRGIGRSQTDASTAHRSPARQHASADRQPADAGDVAIGRPPRSRTGSRRAGRHQPAAATRPPISTRSVTAVR